MNDMKRTRLLSCLIVLGLIGLTVYFPGICIKYYSDDFLFYFDPPPTNIFYYFLHRNPKNLIPYRPLEATFLVAVQQSFGMDTLPIHITVLTLHVVFAWLIFVGMVNYGFRWLQAIIASLFMLCSQANVTAVLGNDTLSQVCGTIFGCMSLFLLAYSAPFANGDDISQGGCNLTCYVLSVCAFTMSLLSKETSTSFFVMLPCIILLKNSKMKLWSARLLRSIIQIGPYLIVLALYFSLRMFIGLRGPHFGSDGYDLHLGLNIVKNFFLFIFQAVLPASSVSTFVAIEKGDLPLLAVLVLSLLVFAAVSGYGVWRSEHRGLLTWLGIFAVLSLFPVVLMNHVSELYLYNAMPFISILIGAGLGKLIELSGTSLMKQIAIILSIGLLFTSHVIAVQSKTFLMKENGERAATLLGHIESYLKEVPRNGQLLLLNPTSDQVEYADFLVNGFNILGRGLNHIMRLAGRTDIKVKIVPQSALQHKQLPKDALVLALDRETGSIYRKQ